MKNVCKLALVSIALAALTFGCRPEDVGPEGGDGRPPSIKASAGEDPQFTLDPVCGDVKTYVLVSEDGSETVNRCFGGASQGYAPVACGTDMPSWGKVTLMNGLTDFLAVVELAPDWVGTAEYVRTAAPADFAFGIDGFPIVDNSWTYRAINPIVGKWPVARTLNTTGNYFGLGIRVTVVQLNALGQVIPNSETTLWLREQVVGTTPQSPYIAEWTRNECQTLPATQTFCTVIDVGAPALSGCTTLTPTIANPVGTVTYQWSTGTTTPTLNVCPSANSSYTVQVSDQSGPRAVYQYDVYLRDIACTVGNGNSQQNRVYICHIPPGNPSGGTDVCVDWSNVRHHVAAYRTNPSAQDHNSGCVFGRCGSSPCY